MRRQARDHGEGGEGQGEVIQVSVRPASLTDLDSSEELLQTGWWGDFKKAHGWNAHPFLVTVTPQDQGAQDQAGQTFGLLVLTRVLLRRFVIAYVPFGPTVDPKCGRGKMLTALAEALRPHLPQGTLFLRYDLPWDKAGEEPGVGGRRPDGEKVSQRYPAPEHRGGRHCPGRLMTFWRP